MGILAGKQVVLGVSGGIAAYKALLLVRALEKEGAGVHVIMTEHATNLVSPLLFRELSGNPVSTTMWGDVANHHVAHIALATLADVFMIAPATANIIGKIAGGIADDMLSTTITATTAPVVIAPAMNTNMFCNPVVQRNLQTLRDLGYHVVAPDAGELACGTVGAGRLPDTDVLVFAAEQALAAGLLRGKRVLVTAGGTREAIDPVRYIGNRSSGKMGYAIAREAARQGAQVTLVSGAEALPDPVGVEVVRITSAREMEAAVAARYETTDIVIKAAAVADYRPAEVAAQKIKKEASEDAPTLQLVKNPDILYGLGQKKTHQILVGFAAETENLLENAAKKIAKKNLDMLVANNVAEPDAGFNTDTNRVTFLFPNAAPEELPLMSKDEVAERIIRAVAELAKAR